MLAPRKGVNAKLKSVCTPPCSHIIPVYTRLGDGVISVLLHIHMIARQEDIVYTPFPVVYVNGFVKTKILYNKVNTYVYYLMPQK